MRFFLILLSLGLLGCSNLNKNNEASQTRLALGTVCTITLYNQGDKALYNRIFKRVDEIGRTMTPVSNLQLGLVNQRAGIEAVPVNDDVFYVVQQALHYASLTKGTFDPTIEPLVALWGIMGENPKVPSPQEIEARLPLIDYNKVVLDPIHKTIFLKEKGMALDLGAIAKGYAVDEAARIIKEAGLERAIVNFGGDVALVGLKPDQSLWKVAVQDPQDKGNSLGLVELADRAVVTSGVYERFFIEDGVRYHHIISPFDGWPVQNGLMSVSVIADNALIADGLSTGLFILGYKEAVEIVNSLDGVEALFVFDDQTIKKTDGFNFTLTSENYSLL